jgi:hypothetical protein
VKIDELKSVAVVGAGSMGRQIALNTALHGFPVRLWDASAEQMQAARGWVDEYVAGRLEKERRRRQVRRLALGVRRGRPEGAGRGQGQRGAQCRRGAQGGAYPRKHSTGHADQGSGAGWDVRHTSIRGRAAAAPRR